jgi:prolyl oligopeptidase
MKIDTKPPVPLRLLLISSTAYAAMIFAHSTVIAQAADPYLWLEQVDSPRVMTWVRAENDKTAAILEKDPRYAGLYKDALAIAEAKDRIPTPNTLDHAIFNFWQDSDHIRGIWRRTTPESYRSASPRWTTVLDLDALAKTENANWVMNDATCVEPDEQHCMLSLSDGGEDAVTVREFDISLSHFAPHGFALAHGKQEVVWQDDRTLLAAREWQPGELTTSGYPFVVKKLIRGETLSQAHEIFRGTKDDVGAEPAVLNDGAGHRAILITREVTTFESENYIVTGGKVAKLGLPRKVGIPALIDNQLIVSLAEAWPVNGRTFKTGSLVAVDASEAARDPKHLKPVLLYAPGPRESFDAAAATRDALLVTTFDNVRGRASVYHREADNTWKRTPLNLPDNITVAIADADLHSSSAYLSVAGFLQPTSLWLLDTKENHPVRIKTLPTKFDASHDVVEQFEATSKDGTKIPYFVVRPKAMAFDGSTPTILNAYGGFGVSSTPFYSGLLGKLWLERGGVFVLANIRGGGEFGPAWHEAALKTHRQTSFDDFASVAQDLIARKVTSPRRLGIQGGSNGGLLVGVEFTQHPELYHAVDIQVPLLDMLRYEQMDAGASWVGEYGSVSIPVERAFLASISPYENLRAGVNYPEPFIWTTTKDDRVGPQQARKFAAKLSAMGVPYLFYEVIEGGHGSGANSLHRGVHCSAISDT